jgi:ankyrin repeat protein
VGGTRGRRGQGSTAGRSLSGVGFYDDPSFGPDPARTIEFDDRARTSIVIVSAVLIIAVVVLLLGLIFGFIGALGSMFSGFGTWSNPPSECEQSTVPLTHAAAVGDDAQVIALLDNGADPNFIDPNNRRAVACAAQADHLDTAMILLHRGADPVALSVSERHAIMLHQIDADDVDDVAFLLDNHVDPGDSLNVLANEAAHGHPKVLRELIRRGADAAAALREAVDSGNLDTTKTLLAAGADPSGNSATGLRTYTPLLRAAFDQRGDIVEVLLAAGADPNDGGEIGSLPFEVAMRSVADRQHNTRIAQLNTSTIVFPGHLPPIVAAAANGDTLMVTRLLQAHADPNLVGLDRFTALHGAVLSDNAQLVQILIDNGAITTPPLPSGAPSPRDLALLNGQTAIAAVLQAATPPTVAPPGEPAPVPVSLP